MVEKSSQHLTAFSTTDGSYTFKKMSFGLVNSGSTFNRMMKKLVHGCSNADNYVDDILGHAIRWYAILSHLEIFLLESEMQD